MRSSYKISSQSDKVEELTRSGSLDVRGLSQSRPSCTNPNRYDLEDNEALLFESATCPAIDEPS